MIIDTPLPYVRYDNLKKEFLFFQPDIEDRQAYEAYSVQDLSDLISFYHTDEIRKTNEIKEYYNRQGQESG